MERLTLEELITINDLLEVEKNIIAKYDFFIKICKDPQVKSKCENFSGKHRNNYDSILDCLK